MERWRYSLTLYENIKIFLGNEISFVCDRALTREYPDKGYGVCIDLTADKTTGTPAIAKFSITGKDFITNKLVGVGGYDGRSSGEVASNVAGSKLVMMGWLFLHDPSLKNSFNCWKIA